MFTLSFPTPAILVLISVATPIANYPLKKRGKRNILVSQYLVLFIIRLRYIKRKKNYVLEKYEIITTVTLSSTELNYALSA